MPTSWVAVGGGLRFLLVHPCSQASSGEIPIALMWKVSSRARTARRACCRCGVHVADGFEPPAECGYRCQRGRVGWGALAGWPLWPTRSLRRERVWFAAEEATSTIVRCVGDWPICAEGASARGSGKFVLVSGELRGNSLLQLRGGLAATAWSVVAGAAVVCGGDCTFIMGGSARSSSSASFRAAFALAILDHWAEEYCSARHRGWLLCAERSLPRSFLSAGSGWHSSGKAQGARSETSPGVASRTWASSHRAGDAQDGTWRGQ